MTNNNNLKSGKRVMTVLLGVILPVYLFAQKAEEVRAKFPGHEAVVLSNSLQYKITIEDGKPVVESKDVQQLLYLSNNASAYLSRYSFTHSSFHQLQAYQAFTRTPDSKKIKVTDFKTSHSKTSGIFYDDVKETAFDFPAIAPGAVGTLELSLRHKNAHLLSPFYFTRGVPVLNSELKISFPKDMNIKYIIRGHGKDRITFQQETRRDEKIFRFTARDLQAERTYPDAPSAAWYSPHIIFYIENYKNNKGELTRHLGTVDDLYRLNYSFISNLNKETKPVITELVDSLTRGISSPELKARKIYRWVQQHVKYVAFEEGMEGFVPRDANLVCTRRFGDCKDMSSILTVMLKTAGIPAYYTWIGTRHLPYRYEEVPTPIVDNHMICTILLDGKYIFLDGTDASCVFGLPSSAIQGKEALVSVNENEYKVLTVPVPMKTINTMTDSTHLVLSAEGLKGTVTQTLNGYFAMNMNATVNYTVESNREKMMKALLQRGSNKFNLRKFNQPLFSDFNHTELNGEFLLPDYVKKAGDDLFINLNLFKHYTHEEIDIPKRTSPIEFSFRSVRKYVTVLTIPPGYKVSYLPKSKSFSNEVWGFDLRYEEKDGKIIFTQSFENELMLLESDKFAAWNKVLEELYPLYKESVNLTKI
jgi:hypothetical protein